MRLRPVVEALRPVPVRTFLAADRDSRAWQRDGRGQGAGLSGGRGAVE